MYESRMLVRRLNELPCEILALIHRYVMNEKHILMRLLLRRCMQLQWSALRRVQMSKRRGQCIGDLRNSQQLAIQLEMEESALLWKAIHALNCIDFVLRFERRHQHDLWHSIVTDPHSPGWLADYFARFLHPAMGESWASV